MKGFIAVFKEKQTGLLNTISTWDSSRFYYEKLEEIAEMEANENYSKEQLFMFTDHNLFLKKRLEVKVAELKNYTAYKDEYLHEHNDLDEKVFEETKGLFEEQERSLMKRVAIRCGQCLLHEIEVTDEIALQCYDLKESGKL